MTLSRNEPVADPVPANDGGMENDGAGTLPVSDNVAAAADWQAAHNRILCLARAQAGLDYEQGVALLAALRANVHLRLGFGSFHEYAERQLGQSSRHIFERLRVAQALEELPQLTLALRSGATSWSVVRELTRVATAETEGDWLAAASNKTVRAVEAMVSGHRPGDRPSDPPDEGARRQVLRFEVSADVAATFREAVAELGRQAGERLSDEDVLLGLARAALVGPGDVGRATYQIAMTVCARCRRGFQQAAGEEIEVSDEVVEMACCDAQDIGDVGAPAGAGGDDGFAQGQVSRDGVQKFTRAVVADRGEPAGAGMTGADAASPYAGGETTAHVGVGSVTVATSAHVGRRRAAQSIPPATRRLVWRRDRGCCVVPGCRNHRFCDVHHLRPRAEGSGHDPDGLVVLCGSHHRAVHDGRLIIEGRVSTGLAFLHADGTRYGAPPCPVAAETFAKVFRALCHMGYRESDARRALARVRAHVGARSEATDASVLREALGVLAA